MGAKHPAYIGELVSLGRNLLRQAKWIEAETALIECLALQAELPLDYWLACNTKLALGEAILSQRRFSEAEPLLIESHRGLKDADPGDYPSIRRQRMIEAVDLLVAD